MRASSTTGTVCTGKSCAVFCSQALTVRQTPLFQGVPVVEDVQLTSVQSRSDACREGDWGRGQSDSTVSELRALLQHQPWLKIVS
jgi:hypothetical protein